MHVYWYLHLRFNLLACPAQKPTEQCIVTLDGWTKSGVDGNQSYCNRKWGPAACHSETSKEASLVERKVCFILDAGNGGGGEGGRGRVDTCRKADSPRHNQGARAFIGWGRGLHVETTQSALTVILKLVMRHHLDCFKYSSSSVSGSVSSHSLRPVLGIVAAYLIATVWSSCS